MPTIEELQAQIQSLQRALQEQELARLPADQRPAYQTQLEIKAQHDALAAERAELNKAALALTAKELSMKTGIPVPTFLEPTSIAGMQQLAVEKLSTMKPEELRNFADMQERLSGLLPKTPEEQAAAAAAAAAGGGAPGAEKTPAGAVTPGGGSGAGAPAPDKTAEITKQFEGKGSDALGEWLGRLDSEVPAMPVTFGGAPNGAVPAVQPGSQTQQPAAATA